MAAALGQPVEVRVPTTALEQQWRQRARHHLVRLAPGAAAPVRIATYAGLGELAVGSLVVLDEAHHLCGTWGRRILEALGPTQRVLGLTGTPPHDNPDWDTFLELVGRDPVTVDAPPLVRDGHLCPYLDLVWPVVADPDDLPELVQAGEALAEAERALGEALGLWVSTQLQEHWLELTEARFAGRTSLLVALARFQVARSRELPTDLPRDPELLAPLSLDDRARLLFACAPERPEVRQALGQAGYRTVRQRLVMDRDVGWQALAGAGTRTRGALEVLAEERAARGDGLRALLITDRDVEGDRLSARGLLKALVRDPRTDPLDPILVTGSVFWVDDDLWPRLAPRVPDLPWRVVGDHHEVDVTGWSTADRVALATRLLEDGVTHCLVGTRHLLGEGWDCPPVNCVLDLTGIRASVTVNQVRGRGLRLDPADPSKVATLWEILVLAPGLPGGDRMLQLLRERHRHTLGLDEHGRIRAGATRIDPRLEAGVGELAAEQDALRERSRRRLHDLAATAAAWAVGQDYLDRRSWRVTGRVATPRQRRIPTPELELELVPAHARSRVGLRVRYRVEAGLLAALGGGLLLALPLGPLSLVGLLPLGAAAWRASRRPPSLHRAALAAVHASLQSLGLAEGRLRHEGEESWVEGDSASSRLFAEAAAELLGPVRHPRYLLVEPGGRTWPGRAALGATREQADTLAAAWARHVGPCEVIWARQGRGREWLRTAWRTGSGAEVALVEVWE